MTHYSTLPTQFFQKVVIGRPKRVIIFVLAVVSFLGYHAKDFKLDASAETLVLQNDKDLQYSRLIDSRYGLQDYLIMIYAPKGDLFSDTALANLSRLRDELRKLKRVSSVVSILDAPLLESPPVPIKELVNNIQTLESPTVDKKLAKIEFKKNPLYQNLLVSSDLKITSLLIYFPVNEVYRDLLARRNNFQGKKAEGPLSAEEEVEFKAVIDQFEKYRDEMKKTRHQDIAAIRGIMDNFRQDAELFLGGVSMIADDLISFIKNDLKVFGLGVLFFLILTLGIIFRKIRWIFLPILCCSFSAISMMGLLGLFGWEVTVISSNFISLQIIITMAITIHLIVRYRELCSENPEADQGELVLDTVRFMGKPCLYAALTTIAGFCSLLLGDILPVITFGWMMSAGISLSLIMTFLLFPSVLMLMDREAPLVRKDARFSLTPALARFTETHGLMIIVTCGIAFILSAVGITRLTVENSFIDYFKHTTEIYQGMKVIDQNLGGTTPFDVIIDFDKDEASEPVDASETGQNNHDVFDEFDEFDSAGNKDKYWFTSHRMTRIMKINDYLDNLPETGKILSLGTMMKIAENLNNGKPLDNFQLALLYSEIPEKYKSIVLTPYLSAKNDQVRFSVRVRDSEKSLKRDRLLKKIRHDLVGNFGLKADQVHLSGMLVLYNNMLQSLFRSQILTLGVVILALMGMFVILFKSLKIACVAIFPNLLSIGVVLGVMGWLNIPLDMMTITIASISVGIAVDDTIHYIHRFKSEMAMEPNYVGAMYRCHGSIGHAMYYTSVTIIIGFSILVLSNFIPSIYFGLLTGLAMFIALIASLTLLPQLLILFKPFGPEVHGNSEGI
ncbi:MAG: RND family transporter [Deltaproteobacteria bacterium]|nr:RND family transporter [Deltaproteobacteria bacterium]MBW1826613.1 RND family transporter [Deltaproteobacteria bacterium]MBW2196345.1 RND family transporter [Deltaproteobacteria bacterium]